MNGKKDGSERRSCVRYFDCIPHLRSKGHVQAALLNRKDVREGCVRTLHLWGYQGVKSFPGMHFQGCSGGEWERGRGGECTMAKAMSSVKGTEAYPMRLSTLHSDAYSAAPPWRYFRPATAPRSYCVVILLED